MWWPGKIPAAKIIYEPLSAMDIYPTLADIVGVKVPTDRVIDGKSFKNILLNPLVKEKIHEAIFFWREGEIYAARYGPYKAHFITRTGYKVMDRGKKHNPPLIY